MKMVDSAVFFPRVKHFVCFALAEDAAAGQNAKSVFWIAAQSAVLSAIGSLFKLYFMHERFGESLMHERFGESVCTEFELSVSSSVLSKICPSLSSK